MRWLKKLDWRTWRKARTDHAWSQDKDTVISIFNKTIQSDAYKEYIKKSRFTKTHRTAKLEIFIGGLVVLSSVAMIIVTYNISQSSLEISKAAIKIAEDTYSQSKGTTYYILAPKIFDEISIVNGSIEIPNATKAKFKEHVRSFPGANATFDSHNTFTISVRPANSSNSTIYTVLDNTPFEYKIATDTRASTSDNDRKLLKQYLQNNTQHSIEIQTADGNSENLIYHSSGAAETRLTLNSNDDAYKNLKNATNVKFILDKIPASTN